MRILNDAVIKDHYDVIVVGSGIGGLTAAALLAKKGVDVLVIEYHYMPGGACTSMRRQDVTFDVGVGMMFGFGETGFNPHVFVMNELEEEIDIIPHECLYQMKIKDKNLTFWRDFERYFKELVSLFPKQEKELRNLYDYFHKLYEDIILKNKIVSPPSTLPPSENIKSLLKNPIGMMRIIPLIFKNTEYLVDKFISDPDVKAFFNMLTCTYCYCDIKETPAMLSGSLFCDNHEGGVFYPVGSPQMLSNKLEMSIEKHGGQMLFRNLVDEILINNNKAYGVRLTDGTEIMAGRVIANGTVWNLYGKLIKPEHIKPKKMEWAQSFVPSYGSLCIYLGVDAEAVPEDTPPILMLVEDMYNITGNDITLYISSIDDPSLCPPDMHTFVIIQPSMSKWPNPDDPEYKSEKYQLQKKEATDKLLDEVENYFPDLRKHIRVMDVGTPTTIERFTLKNWGAVGGPKLMMGQDMLNRLKSKSEWKNLYLCGDSTEMGIGIPATTVSGVGAANLVLRDLKQKEFSPREFSREYVKFVDGPPWTTSPDPMEPITEENAPRIAKDCQHCEKPGCKDACPANIETCYFARRIEGGNFAGAARAVREVNPLSEICGYICPSERFCEKNCSRLDFSDKPMRIRELHGWICGYVSNDEGWSSAEKQNGHTVAVIGAGPAGLTCAHYLARLGYRVDIMDKANSPGGIIAHAVPSSRLPQEIIKREIEGLTLPGMNFQYGKALGKDLTIEDLENDYNAIFLAPGMGDGIMLDIPGLDKSKTTDALRFLKSHHENTKGQVGDNVLVIGGGSVASDAAISAKAAGAANVTLVCLEKEHEMPALKSEIAELKKHGISIENAWGPKALATENKMSFIACTKVFDDQGKFKPVYDESQTKKLEFDQVIWAVGQRTETDLADYLKNELGNEDLIEVDEDTMQIKDRSGIYAGGDIIRGAGTVAQAVGDGRRAAQAIDQMIKVGK